MVTENPGPGKVTRCQNQPYSGWFVLGKILLWVYNAGFLTLLAIIGLALVVLGWTGEPLDRPDFVPLAFGASAGMMYGGGWLLSLLVLWMLPKKKGRVTPWREVWLPITVFVPISGFRSYREVVRISDKADRRMFQFTVRTLLKLAIGACLLASYGSCYYEISRAGMAEAEATGMEGFFYVPFDDIYAAGDVTPRHFLLTIFFAPANLVDHFVFGSPEALTHAPTMRLT